MKHYYAVLAITIGAALAGQTGRAASIVLTGTIRDFHYNGTSTSPLAGHPDFENVISDDRGMVASALGADGTPVYSHPGSSTVTTHGEAFFNEWYHDTPGVNLSELYPITLNETAPGSGIYSYDNSAFFPIDNQLGGNQGSSHNYSFTYQIHTTFTYQPGQVFGFTGDDDVWVFINKRLALDLGGVHGAESAAIALDSLGLTAGVTYDFDFFFAERHTVASDMRIQTSIPLVNNSAPPNLVKNNLVTGTNVTIGEVFFYAISFDTYSNAIAAVSLHLVDQLPPEVDFLDATTNGALSVVYDPPTHTIIWDFGTWPPLTAGPTNYVTVRVNNNAVGQTNIVNLASMVSSNLPPVITVDHNPRCPTCPGVPVCAAPTLTLAPAANRGYYQIGGTSVCYGPSQLQFYVQDTASTFVAGPYSSGTIIKIKKSVTTGIGPASGPASVTIKVLGNGQVYVVDPAAQTSAPVTCLSL